MVNAQADDLEAQQRQVAELARQAERAAQTYDRHDRFTWIGYAVVFLAIPFVVLLFRLHMEAWHYYLAGALILASALGVSVMDLVAIAKRDEVIQAFERARATYERAVANSPAGDPPSHPT